MLQLNSITRLGKDAEVRQLPSGKSVINFSGAADVGYGENKKTLWIEFSHFTDKTTVAQYLKKGTEVFVSGEPSLRTYTTNDGRSGASLQCIVRELRLIGGTRNESPQPATQQQPAVTGGYNEPGTEDDGQLPF